LAAYDWFGRWLRGSGDRQPEPEVTIASEEELYCTPTGQVGTSLGGETVITLNRQRAERLSRNAKVSADAVRQAIGFQHPAGNVPVRPFGVIDRPQYSIEKLVYESEPGISIPALVYEAPAEKRQSCS
jgi:hypothetical protein